MSERNSFESTASEAVLRAAVRDVRVAAAGVDWGDRAACGWTSPRDACDECDCGYQALLNVAIPLLVPDGE